MRTLLTFALGFILLFASCGEGEVLLPCRGPNIQFRFHPSPPVTLTVDERRILSVAVHGACSDLPAGAIVWTSQDPDMVRIEAASDSTAILHAVRPGQVQVTAERQDIEAAATLTVQVVAP